MKFVFHLVQFSMFDLAKQMILDSLTMRVFVSVIGMLHYGTTKYLIDIIQPTLNENVVGWNRMDKVYNKSCL